MRFLYYLEKNSQIFLQDFFRSSFIFLPDIFPEILAAIISGISSGILQEFFLKFSRIIPRFFPCNFLQDFLKIYFSAISSRFFQGFSRYFFFHFQGIHSSNSRNKKWDNKRTFWRNSRRNVWGQCLSNTQKSSWRSYQDTPETIPEVFSDGFPERFSRGVAWRLWEEICGENFEETSEKTVVSDLRGILDETTKKKLLV